MTSKKYTDIQVNGSHFAGEEPDSIEKLIDVLKNHPLDRFFGNCTEFNPVWITECGYIEDEVTGNMVNLYLESDEQPVKNSTFFFGNFLDISHAFTIYTNDKKVINKLSVEIEKNMKRENYLSQPKPSKWIHYIQYKDGRKERRED